MKLANFNEPPMNKQEIESIYALSPMQQGMLFHSLYEPDTLEYVEQTACKLVGCLNSAAFERAWQKVVDRHSILRTAFVWRKVEQPMQVVQRHVQIPFICEDWGDLPVDEQECKLTTFMHADRLEGFELSKAPLMRLALFKTGQNEHYFVWTYHHILLDGWSLPLLINEVLVSYEAINQGQDLTLPAPRPYQDYIKWQQKQDLVQAENFWRNYLRGFTSPTPSRIRFHCQFEDRSG